MHLRRRDVRDKLVINNHAIEEEYNNKLLRSEHFKVKNKKDMLSLKEKSSVVMYNSVKFKNKEIVEYSRTNFSLAENVVDNLTLDKLIKSPLMRKHDIINDTVDVWAEKSICSYDDVNIIRRHNVSYKPLIFGGTYPIDEPTGLQIRKSDKSLHTENINENKTFNIDRPLSLDN